MRHSPWGTSTVFATIPIALLVGIYMKDIRPGRVLEASLIGVALLLLAVGGGGWVDSHPVIRQYFDLDAADARLVRHRLWLHRRRVAGVAAACTA